MIKLAPGDLAALPARGDDPSLESIALRRKLAAALMAKAADTSPVGHWTQALARGLQGWGGYLQDQKADKQDRGLRKDANAALLQLLAPSVTGGASPVAAPPQPAMGQAQEAMLPDQPMTPDQQGVATFAQGMGTPNMAASIPKVAGALDPDLVNSVKGSEGYNPKPYWDYKQWTNGYGTRAQGPNDVIDKPGAEKRLAEELSKAQAIVDQHAPNAPPGVKKALTSLTFNAGDKWTRSGLGAAVKAGDYDTAQRKFMQYVKADGQTLPGLVQRRQKEAQWFNQQGQPQQAQQPAQVADASGQTVDRATLERMLQNPYSRDAALKILQSQGPMSQEQRMNLELKQAQIDALRAKSQSGGDAQREQRMQMLQGMGIDPNSAEGKAVLINGKLPAAAYEQMNQRQLRTTVAPKIGEGLNNLSKMTTQYDDASFENAVGPFQGATPDGLFSAGPINAARLWGEIRNWWDGGNVAPSEVRSNIQGSTEALAAAIKPLIRAPGEGVWTDQDQARLVSVVGDLAQARDKPEFERRLEAVRERIKANFNLDIPGGKNSSGGWSIQKVQ